MTTAIPKYVTRPCSECGHATRVLNGAWLRQRREQAGLDQRVFAKRSGFTGPYISDIERNRRACPDIVFREYLMLSRRSRRGAQ